MNLLAVAKTGAVVILCKNYIECRIAVANALLSSRVDIGFGDGMHYADIAKVFDYFYAEKAKLGIVATQNPIVFDHLAFASAEDVRARVLLVRDDELVNMSEEKADAIFRSFETGIQHVSEIFRVEGVW